MPGMLLHTCCYGMVLVGSDRLDEACDIIEWCWLITPSDLNDLAERRRNEYRAKYELGFFGSGTPI